MSDQVPSFETDSNFVLQTDLLQTPDFILKLVTEAPLDGVAYQESYSDPCLVINFGAQLSTFEVVGDSKHGYQGTVIPGDFSFLPPNTMLEGYYQGDRLCYAYMIFPQERLNFQSADKLLIMHSDPLIQKFAQALFSQRHRQDPDIVLYRESMSEALVQHLQLVHLDATSDLKLKPNLDRLKNYILANINRKLTVAELAKLEETTTQSLQKSVQAEYGQSVYQWVTTLRLERSLELLRNTPLNLVTIAIDCGFANQSHWTRLFRRQFGITPGNLRSQSNRSY